MVVAVFYRESEWVFVVQLILTVGLLVHAALLYWLYGRFRGVVDLKVGGSWVFNWLNRRRYKDDVKMRVGKQVRSLGAWF